VNEAFIRYSYETIKIDSSMASSIHHYFRISGITMGWTGLGVVGALAALSICTGLMIRYSYGTKNIVSTMPLSQQNYFRISGIPTGWKGVNVVCGLKSLEPTRIHDGQHLHLSLYPACSGSTQTGLQVKNSSKQLSWKKSSWNFQWRRRAYL
jgi:hypothetical protein